MRQSQTAARRRAPRARNLVSPLLAFALCLSAAAAVITAAAATTARAQSGRRSQKPLSPVPTPTPAADAPGESESEGLPKKDAGDDRIPLAVFKLTGVYTDVAWIAQDLVMETFINRLTRSKSLSATAGGDRITRKEAQERAKKEQKTYVVLVELQEDMGTASMSRGDTRFLSIRTYVYEPVTGTLKYVDNTSQRPYRQAATIGGIPLPIPAPRTRVERFPNELQIEQAARDAADRLMMRFSVNPPPDN